MAEEHPPTRSAPGQAGGVSPSPGPADRRRRLLERAVFALLYRLAATQLALAEALGELLYAWEGDGVG